LENSNRQRRPFHHIKLTLYRHIRTAEHRTIVQQYGDWYTGRLMDGLLHLVQRGGVWASCGTAQSPPRCTK